MILKTSDLTEPALDYLVAKRGTVPTLPEGVPYSPSTNWAHGGLIIARRRLLFKTNGPMYIAYPSSSGIHGPRGSGPTHLVAAMRCVVAIEYGASVDVPDALIPQPK